MNFFLLLFVVATAVCGEAAKANPRGNSKVDLAELKAELTERRVRMKRVLAKLREKAKRQNIGLNGPNVVDLEQAVDKRRAARTAFRASNLRQDINLDPLEAYLSQLDQRISALENSTDDAVTELESRMTKLESALGHKKDNCVTRMFSASTTSSFGTASYSGKPGASSVYGGTHTADLAFKPQGSGYPWASNALPGTVWYKFNYYFKLAMISFTSRTGSSWSQTPKTFEVVGSYDCSQWHVLRSVSNANFTKGGQEKSWQISCSKQKSYNCYGIKASAPMSSSTGKLVSLTNIQMFHLPEH